MELHNTNKPIIDTMSFFCPRHEEENEMLMKIKSVLINNLDAKIEEFRRLGTGQNINYKIFTSNCSEPKYLLRVISKRGYPSIETLGECYRLLKNIGMGGLTVLYNNSDTSVTPYGFFVQNWVEGIDAEEKYGRNGTSTEWLKDFVAILKQVHSIKLSYFGYLSGGPRYQSLREYFNNMDEVIDYSFDGVFKRKHSIWELQEKGITSPEFLTDIFKRIKDRASGIQSRITPVLLHGDMFPANLIYTSKGPLLIDWDETRAGWWGYEIARTVLYMNSQELFESFMKFYGGQGMSIEEICTGIKLEQVRQMLRRMFMLSFGAVDFEGTKKRVVEAEKDIIKKLDNGLFV